MFKCKQCGRQFGANVPKACPGCGAACNNEDRGVGRMLVFGSVFVLGDVLIFAVVAAVVFALMAWYFGWF